MPTVSVVITASFLLRSWECFLMFSENRSLGYEPWARGLQSYLEHQESSTYATFRGGLCHSRPLVLFSAIATERSGGRQVQSKLSRNLSDSDRRCSPHRRRALFTLLGTAVTALTAGPSDGQSTQPSHDGAPLLSVATPKQTEGPYFIDDHLNRSAIRSDPGNSSTTPTSPLPLQIRLT